jgi:hypothetical protein
VKELDQCVKAALEGCGTACGQHLDELKRLVGVLVTPLQELATDVGKSANSLVAGAAVELVAALDNMKQPLASYTFPEV